MGPLEFLATSILGPWKDRVRLLESLRTLQLSPWKSTWGFGGSGYIMGLEVPMNLQVRQHFPHFDLGSSSFEFRQRPAQRGCLGKSSREQRPSGWRSPHLPGDQTRPRSLGLGSVGFVGFLAPIVAQS